MLSCWFIKSRNIFLGFLLLPFICFMLLNRKLRFVFISLLRALETSQKVCKKIFFFKLKKKKQADKFNVSSRHFKSVLRNRCVATHCHETISGVSQSICNFSSELTKSFPNLIVCLPIICDVRSPNLKTRR